jgi:succinoglycan biosynthesis transport protein ExoP
MEDEIDLRAYIEVLVRHWIWIVGLAVLAVVVAFSVTSFLPPTYEASSVVLVTEPRYQMQFDSRFETEQRTPAYNAFPTLAESDGILQDVLQAYDPPPGSGLDPWSLATLSGIAEATSGGDPSLVLLSIRSGSAHVAADLANIWADVLVERGNAIYGGGTKEVGFFEEQLAQAGQALDEAESALVAFEARNQGSIIQARLDSLNQAQADYLASQRTVAYIIQDIQGLRAQLAEQSGSQPASLGDSLTALLLQIKAFNVQASSSEAAPITPIQLQIESGVALSEKTQAEQVTFLDRLAATLEAKSSEIDARLSELEPQILEAQERLQEIETESARLTRARDLASDTYLTLARKLEEARIAAQEENGMLQVGSYAAVPVHPIGPRRLMNTVVAGLLGVTVGVVAAFGIEFWRSGTAQEAEQSTAQAVKG